MQVQNLGVLRGDITLFGGPYSNAQALEALLRVSAGTTRICTGDLVAYCSAPAEVVAQSRAAGVHVVAGNCEKQLAARASGCGCGFEQGSACDLLSAGWYAYANARTPDADRAWMAALPDILTFEHAQRRYAVIHGGLSDVARFIWPSSDTEMAQEIRLIKDLCSDIDVIIAGHCGIAFARQKADVRWINAGVIGMPPNDGTQLTDYVRLSAAGVITFEKLRYDAQGAAEDMVAAGLIQGYQKALTTGYWPSEDILPEALRRVPASLASG